MEGMGGSPIVDAAAGRMEEREGRMVGHQAFGFILEQLEGMATGDAGTRCVGRAVTLDPRRPLRKRTK